MPREPRFITIDTTPLQSETGVVSLGYNVTTHKVVKTTGDTTGDGAALHFRLAWDAATAYLEYDVVSYNGSKWIALAGSTNSAPVEGVDWTALGGTTPSGAANLFYATPSGAAGDAVLRAITGADLPTASTLEKGAVLFAADGNGTAGRAVLANDRRIGVYDIQFEANGKATGGNAVLYRTVIPRAFISSDGNTLNNLTRALTAATGATSWTVARAPLATPTTFTSVYTISWAAAGSVPTWTGVEVTWAAGDMLRVIGPTTADATLADVVGTLTGKLI